MHKVYFLEGRGTHIVQNLAFELGHNVAAIIRDRPMAHICQLSRGPYMPPPYTTVSDWFHYAFNTTEIIGKFAKGLKDFIIFLDFFREKN